MNFHYERTVLRCCLCSSHVNLLICFKDFSARQEVSCNLEDYIRHFYLFLQSLVIYVSI